MGDCFMAKFTRKEIKVADILIELVDLIPRFDRRNSRMVFPTWNTKRSRYLPRRSHFAKAGLPISRPNCCFLHHDFMAPSPSSISPHAHHPSEENPFKGRKDGIIIDLNKDPEEVFAYEDPEPSSSKKPFRSQKGFKEESFIDDDRRNSEERVLLDGDKFEVNIIMNVQSSKLTLENKRKREEPIITSMKNKKMRVDLIPFLHL